MSETLEQIVGEVAAGSLDVEAAAARIRAMSCEPLGFATVDHARAGRCGAAEAIFAVGKTADQIVQIARAIRGRGHVALVTRAHARHVQAIRSAFAGEDLETGSRGGTVLIGRPPQISNRPPIAVVTAGTSDEAVAEEAQITCLAQGHAVHRINDVGVAGLHRLGARLPELKQSRVIICIAGMEGALPSVIAGLVRIPVIAVPTSVGYGVSFGGVAALLGMLSSCAAGVVVVNIDNGYGAAHAACRVNEAVGCEP